MCLWIRSIAHWGNEVNFLVSMSLTVACSTMSQPRAVRLLLTVVISLCIRNGRTRYFGHPVQFKFAGDEHGVLLLQKGEREVGVGTVHQFITPHCDPTVNLHDNLGTARRRSNSFLLAYHLEGLLLVTKFLIRSVFILDQYLGLTSV